MADINLSVTHTLTLDDSGAQEKDCATPVTCLANDYALTYGRVMIQVNRRGPQEVEPLTGMVEDGANLVMNLLAKIQKVTERDVQQSHAMYRVNDTKFRVTVGDCPWRPEPGDQVIDPTGQKHDVLGVDTLVLGTRYLLWCRDAS